MDNVYNTNIYICDKYRSVINYMIWRAAGRIVGVAGADVILSRAERSWSWLSRVAAVADDPPVVRGAKASN